MPAITFVRDPAADLFMTSGDTVSVTVRLFAGVREAAGVSSVDVELPAPATISQAVEAASRAVPGVWRLPKTVLLASNGEYASNETPVDDGDEVAIIPPVSGGADPDTQTVTITDDPLDPGPLTEFVRTEIDGAVVTFLGVTRNHNEGRRVLFLEYEAYRPMADKVIAEIIGEMKSRFEIGRVAIAHRTGRVDIGETSMVVAVGAAHRRPAFEAALHFIDQLKRIVPIWKKEYFEGGEVWIGDTPGSSNSAAR